MISYHFFQTWYLHHFSMALLDKAMVLTNVPKYGCRESIEHILGTKKSASSDRMLKAESMISLSSLTSPITPFHVSCYIIILNTRLTRNQERGTNKYDNNVTSIPNINCIKNRTSIEEFANFIICKCCKPNVQTDFCGGDSVAGNVSS